MVSRLQRSWDREISSNERRLRQLGICGTVIVCVGMLFLMAASQKQTDRRNAPVPMRIFTEPPPTVPVHEEFDFIEWMLLPETILYVIAVTLLTQGHALSRWAAFRQGVLSSHGSATE